MLIKVFQGGYDKNLCYLIWCEESKRAAIIDPSVETNVIFEFIEKNRLILEKILITHTHHDHVSFLEDFLFRYSNVNIYGYNKPVKTLPGNFIGVSDREIINIGKNILTVIHTPGHYPDCVCYWSVDQEYVFTGDTMFVGRSGRTISTGSLIEELYDSIYKKILDLPRRTKIFPGHNYGFSKSCSIQKNIQYSPFFQCKSLSEFKIVMENYERNRK